MMVHYSAGNFPKCLAYQRGSYGTGAHIRIFNTIDSHGILGKILQNSGLNVPSTNEKVEKNQNTEFRGLLGL